MVVSDIHSSFWKYLTCYIIALLCWNDICPWSY